VYHLCGELVTLWRARSNKTNQHGKVIDVNVVYSLKLQQLTSRQQQQQQ